MKLTLGTMGDADISGTITGSGGGVDMACVDGLTPSGDSCGPDPTIPTSSAGMVPNSPSSGCMPGDMLSYKNGNWLCVTNPNYTKPVSNTLLLAGLAAMVALVMIRTK